MDYTKAAEEILELCGGKGNVSSVTHCATRLRLFIINKETVDTAQMKKIKGVLGTVYSGDELQIVLGKNLIPVYQETVRLHGEKIQGEAKIPEESKTAGADGGKRAGRADGPRGIKELGGRLVGFISAAVTPMIPGLVAGGMLPSVDKGAHALSAVFWRLAALTSIGVRPVRLIPLPCQPPKYGTWGPKEFCASDL